MSASERGGQNDRTHSGTTQGQDALTMSGRLLCSTPKLLESGADTEYWLTQSVETIGSDSGCTVQIRSPEISALHARVTVTANQWTIQAGIDGPGVFINGNQIDGSSPLSGGDEVRLGPVVFSFSILDVAPSDFAVMPDAPTEAPEIPAFKLGQTLQLELSPDGELIDVSKGAKVKTKAPGASVRTGQEAPAAQQAKPGATAADKPTQASATKPTLEASMAALQEELPNIIQRLVLEAKKGNIDASCACLIYASRFVGRK